MTMPAENQIPPQSTGPARESRFNIQILIRKNIIPVLLASLTALVYARNSFFYPDNVAYFAYLPAIWKTHNLDMFAEFTKYGSFLPVILPAGITSMGYVVNVWPVGCALMWSPLYVLSLLFHNEILSAISADFTSALIGLLTLCLLYRSLIRLQSNHRVSLALTLITYMGTPLFYYTLFSRNSHALTAGLAAVFLAYWLRTRSDPQPMRWCFLGLLLGVMTSVRPQEILFGWVLLVEIIDMQLQQKDFRQLLQSLLLTALFFCIGFSPQSVSWKVLFGSWTAQPQSHNMDLHNFALLETLFSPYHGVLFWTPVMLLGIGGLILGLKRHRILSIAMLGVCIAQILANSMSFGFWNGFSFGIRTLTDLSFIIGIGLFFVFTELKGALWRTVFFSIASICALWTFFLALNALSGHINLDQPYTTATFLAAVLKLHGTFLPSFGKLFIPTRAESFLPCFILAFAFYRGIRWIIESFNTRILLCLLLAAISYIAVFNAALLHASKSPPVYDRSYFISHKEWQEAYVLMMLYERHRYFTVSGKSELAEITEARIQEIAPKDPLLHLNRGSFLYSQNKFDDAIIEFRKALELNPVLSMAYENLATACLAARQNAEAITVCKRAIALWPQKPSLYMRLGYAYYELHDSDMAYHSLTRALSLGARENHVFFCLGTIHQSRGELQKAKECYLQAVMIDPDDADSHLNLGRVFFSLKEYSSAEAEYLKVIALRPDDAAAHEGLYSLYLSAGKKDKARQIKANLDRLRP
ncbi:MAG: tetratricopeptide repeat protein [Candidatus Xenobiia bacterium LiM19]